MSENDRIRKLCLYRLEQADEALAEMELLKTAGHYRGSINRAYYSMFYAIQALLIQNKVKVSKHTGVIAFFDREFVKPGIIDPLSQEMMMELGVLDSLKLCKKIRMASSADEANFAAVNAIYE